MKVGLFSALFVILFAKEQQVHHQKETQEKGYQQNQCQWKHN